MDLSRSSGNLSSRSNSKVGGGASPFGLLGLVDPILLVTSLALTAFGVFAVYVAGSEDGEIYALNQFLGFLVGLVGAIPLALMDYRELRRYMPLIYGFALVTLFAVAVIGINAKGGQRWIDIGPIQFQPSEFAKICVVVVLAGYFADNRLADSKVFITSLGIVALPALLVFAQPDLGTALVFGAAFFSMTFVGGAKFYQLGLLALAAAASFACAIWLGILEEYQIARLTSFVDPAAAATTGEGYQVFQSKIAIGSGGLTGKGLDAVTLATLGFLPEDHTDFIFSALAERVGFVGGVLLIGLFFILVWRMLHVATIARDRFGVLIAVGIATIFLFHVFVNIGMTVGMMPVTGIPLPFVSYGRSSLVVSVIALGLLQSIVMRAKSEGLKEANP